MLRWLLSLAVFASSTAVAADPLPSWKNGPSKKAIKRYVDAAVDESNSGFVPVQDRIAVFDNDGTLWAEQPMYTQMAFALDRVKDLALQHPEWNTTEPFESALRGDLHGVMEMGTKGLVQLIVATHSGTSTDDFADIVNAWIRSAKHPDRGVPYTEMVYQPMLELMDYLRAKEFKVFIVSGGGVGFMRPWSYDVYGVPPEQVVGSTLSYEYDVVGGVPVVKRLPELDFVDDGPGKPVGIARHIGRRPAMAFGNSDGDLQMLEWTCAGDGARFCAYIHHTDGVREWAYDRDGHIGTLDKGLDRAAEVGWTVVDMRKEWKTVFPTGE